jgi:hypothetical protein
MRERSPVDTAATPPVQLRDEATDFRSQDDRHRMEYAVRRALLSHPELQFSSLVIRRVRDGVCLEGVLNAAPDSPDVCSLAQTVAGVNQVLNHLVTRNPERPSVKG